jgi:hypothetical protein|tara:strand:+ start:12945 stop:13094 length:150 start_codon:yes stop_codon:yes gene_type:complete
MLLILCDGIVGLQALRFEDARSSLFDGFSYKMGQLLYYPPATIPKVLSD